MIEGWTLSRVLRQGGPRGPVAFVAVFILVPGLVYFIRALLHGLWVGALLFVALMVAAVMLIRWLVK